MRPLIHATLSAGALEVNLSDALYRSFRIATTTLVSPTDRPVVEDDTESFESPLLPMEDTRDGGSPHSSESIQFAPYVFRNLTGLEVVFQQQTDTAPRKLGPVVTPKVYTAPNGSEVPFVYEEPTLQLGGRAGSVGLRMIQVTVHGASHPISNLPVDAVSRRVRGPISGFRRCVDLVCVLAQMCTARFGDHKVTLNWEVTLGETGKIVTLRSHTIVYNRTSTSIEVAMIGRDRSVTVVGTVAGPGCMAIPMYMTSPPAIVVRPSFRACHCVVL
jgi:hypothetical protein